MFLKDLEAHHVREYYSQCIRSGLSAQTVLHIHRLFRQALKQAVSWNMLLRNVLDDVAPPMTNRPEIRILTPEEINVLLETAKGTDFSCRYTWVYSPACGARRYWAFNFET